MDGKHVGGICDGCKKSKIPVKFYKVPLGDKDANLCDWCAQTLLGNCAAHPGRELTNNELAQIVFFAARRVIEAIEKNK